MNSQRIQSVRLIHQCIFPGFIHPEMNVIDAGPGMGIAKQDEGYLFTYGVGGLLASVFIPLHNILQVIYENEVPIKVSKNGSR